MRRVAVPAIVVCLLVGSIAVAPIVGAGEISGTGSDSQDLDSPDETAAECFPGDGYEFQIGSQGPQIDAIVHLSLLSNLGAPGTLGIEMAGSTASDHILTLRTGVIFEGVDSASNFTADPLAYFSLAFEYDFQLPMFADATGEDFTLEDDGAPFDAPIGDAACSPDEEDEDDSSIAFTPVGR